MFDLRTRAKVRARRTLGAGFSRIGRSVVGALRAWPVLVVLVAVATGATAHEHMYIGSTTPGAGALTLRYDFARKFPLDATTATHAEGIDPAFAAQLADDPANGLYQLPDDVPVWLKLVAVDPGVSVLLNDKTLSHPGDKLKIATSPYLHVHPTWMIDGPPGDYGLAFVISQNKKSPTFADSQIFVATLTNIATTTTSDVPTTITTTTTTSTSTTSTTTTLPFTNELLPGASLAVRLKPSAPAKRSLALGTRDASVTLGDGPGSADDPTLAGGTLRVASVAGQFDATYVLPAANWSRVGKPGQTKGYKYVDKIGGPVTSAKIAAGKSIALAARGALLAVDLVVDPAPVDVVLTIGRHRYCLAFGGLTKFKPDATFRAKQAAAPTACAP